MLRAVILKCMQFWNRMYFEENRTKEASYLIWDNEEALRILNFAFFF